MRRNNKNVTKYKTNKLTKYKININMNKIINKIINQLLFYFLLVIHYKIEVNLILIYSICYSFLQFVTHFFSVYAIISRVIPLYRVYSNPTFPRYQIEVKVVCQDKIDFNFDIVRNNKITNKYKTK